MQGFDFNSFLMYVVAIVLGITIHEFAHAFAADRLGDDTPRAQGRVTLSPLAHLDPVGSLFLVVSAVAGMGIGWGRPVQTDINAYRINKRIGHAIVVLAGPLSNLILATLFALVLRSGVIPSGDAYFALANAIVLTNIRLCFFNLIPLYPLDGSHLLAAAMPPAQAQGYYRFMQQWGFLLFIALVMSGLLGPLILPPSRAVYTFLMGAA
jgi:Zn-dependent protease